MNPQSYKHVILVVSVSYWVVGSWCSLMASKSPHSLRTSQVSIPHATLPWNKTLILIWLVVSNIFYFHPNLGKIPILTHIFQMGWNHQLVIVKGQAVHHTNLRLTKTDGGTAQREGDYKNPEAHRKGVLWKTWVEKCSKIAYGKCIGSLVWVPKIIVATHWNYNLVISCLETW